MRQRVAVALMLAGLAIPMFAQRGGGRGGFSGGGVRGGFSGGGMRSGGAPMLGGRSFSAPMGYRGVPSGYRGYGAVPQRSLSMRSGGMRVSPTVQAARSGYAGARSGCPGGNGAARRGRGGYPVRFRPAFPYPYGVSEWIAPGYLGYVDPGLNNDDSLYYEGSGEPFDSASLASGSPEDTYVEVPQTPEDYAQNVDTYGRPQPAPKAEAGVTLIFKDRRPPETIHNYMLTQTNLMVIKGQRQYDIPVAELDVAATEQANKAAGVVFQLPHATP
jgi:hypothetical protein